MVQCPTTSATNTGPLTLERLQDCSSRFHSKFPEQSQNSLKEPVQERSDHPQCNKDHQSGIRSKFREASQHLLGTLNIGRARVQAASRVDPKQVPLTGYEQYPRKYKHIQLPENQ